MQGNNNNNNAPSDVPMLNPEQQQEENNEHYYHHRPAVPSLKEDLTAALQNHPLIFLANMQAYPEDSKLRESNYHTGESVERNLIRQMRYYRSREFPEYRSVLKEVNRFTLKVLFEGTIIDLRELDRTEGKIAVRDLFA